MNKPTTTQSDCMCHCHPGSKFFGTEYTIKPKHMKTIYCEACKRGENCEHCQPMKTTTQEQLLENISQTISDILYNLAFNCVGASLDMEQVKAHKEQVVKLLEQELTTVIETTKKESARKYGEPLSTFIQWKGTDLCMDWFCEDGHQNHTDADFAYSIECDVCHKIYKTGDKIELTRMYPRQADFTESEEEK